jgi:hypothetical protein
VTELPAPANPDAPVGALVEELAERLGQGRFTRVCLDLLAGADRTDYVAELRYLTGHPWQPGDATFDPAVWSDYWLRTWGARGLLHVWDEAATDAVVAGLGDEHWRPAEMCLKVAARHGVAGTGDGAATLASHELPRVRAAAMRALAVVGDTEHAAAVRDRLDDPEEGVRRAAGRAWEQLAARLDLPEGP